MIAYFLRSSTNTPPRARSCSSEPPKPGTSLMNLRPPFAGVIFWVGAAMARLSAITAFNCWISVKYLSTVSKSSPLSLPIKPFTPAGNPDHYHQRSSDVGNETCQRMNWNPSNRLTCVTTTVSNNRYGVVELL